MRILPGPLGRNGLGAELSGQPVLRLDASGLLSHRPCHCLAQRFSGINRVGLDWSLSFCHAKKLYSRAEWYLVHRYDIDFNLAAGAAINQGEFSSSVHTTHPPPPPSPIPWAECTAMPNSPGLLRFRPMWRYDGLYRHGE